MYPNSGKSANKPMVFSVNSLSILYSHSHLPPNIPCTWTVNISYDGNKANVPFIGNDSHAYGGNSRKQIKTPEYKVAEFAEKFKNWYCKKRKFNRKYFASGWEHMQAFRVM